MRKSSLLEELVSTRTDFLESIAGLVPDEYLITGVTGLWSVKDILAHLVVWESEVVTALNHIQNKKFPSILHIEDIDEWNDEQYRANLRRPLEAIREDFDGVHKMLLNMLQDFDEHSLTDNRRYPFMEGEPLWYLIEENVTLHEREHAQEIRAWREGRPASH